MAEKKIFKIKIKDMTKEEQEQFFKDVIAKFKKDPTSFIDEYIWDEYIWDGIVYFTKKRDNLIEHLVEKIKYNEEEGLIQSILRSILIITKQLKMMEDANIIYRINKEK
jgi:hypothetical protein